MAQETQTAEERQREIREKLEAMRDPGIDAYIAEGKRRYAKYTLPLEELRARLKKEMGNVTLTDALFEMREKSF